MKGVWDFFKRIRVLILILILAFICNIGYDVYIISGDSMKPSLENNEVVLVNKLFYGPNNLPRQGDVVVIYHEQFHEFLIKRILAVPGDEVEVLEGDIYINGHKHVDEFSHVKLSVMLVELDGSPSRNWETGEVLFSADNAIYPKLKGNEYWVIGDNRDMSWYGTVFEYEIIGKLN